ncbi:unnamed protein product [Allacma fusca]|uniref:Major facilitator superfamily (MFS) profile domain-containing protein n=1 Tax=Allacma fusca TaxID=39272 RepID=A0A8J2PC43_9HEXA|nr:unnamed protein product [Allacma fusca]
MAVKKQGTWMLLLLGSLYLVGELGHFLVGVVSRSVAQEIHYGDLACFPKPNLDNLTVEFKFCEEGNIEEECTNLTSPSDPNVHVCKWDYSGLGLEYQILAGPSFILVFTVSGIVWGLVADRFNRVRLLTMAALMFSASLVGAAFATKYWHLILSRMLLAAGESGCSPLAAGMISDTFPLKQRAFAMSLFNWGIYIGYGLSYAIGTYVTEADIFEQGWRASFFVSGVPGILLAILFFFTTKDPERQHQGAGKSDWKDEPVGESNNDLVMDDNSQQMYGTIKVEEKPSTVFTVLRNPIILMLGAAACIRHSAGLCWGYNSALYFQKYYPDYSSAGWWLMGISIGGGTVGAAFGGFFSDRLVKSLGISSRAVVLASSQLLATPFSLGLLYLDPPYAFFSLLIGYVFAEMWFGVMFTILMELVPLRYRSTALAIALFIINNVGGNVPVLVHPISSVTSYRTAITIFYSGALFTSSMLFFVLYIWLRRKKL